VETLERKVMSTEDIYNYLQVDEQTITGGQPLEAQLQAAANEGFTTVINLAPTDEDNALPDEAGFVQSLGLTYYYIPVDWGNPTEQDFAAFEAAMSQRPAGKTLIHCAANFRATAFYSLYALKHLDWTVEQAEAFRALIWGGGSDPIWAMFIDEMTEKLSS
jgi:uncharacterized protein (TIGR01244 family)